VEERSTPAEGVVARALAVLSGFDTEHRRLTLTELASHAGLPMPTTLRLVRQLVAGGALERAQDRRYVVGRRLWDLGLLAPMETDLRELASPYLHDLQAVTRATVHLAVREGTAALYLDRLSGIASVPVISRVGARLPLHATGVGKVLLAYAPAEIQRQVLSHLTRDTPYTVTYPRILCDQLAKVRRDGYATTAEEMTLGACSVAVPVRDAAGTVIAALGIVVPPHERERGHLSSALGVAAQGLQRELARRSATL
jgi:DNA-binding IclR family transcriptional regulator